MPKESWKVCGGLKKIKKRMLKMIWGPVKLLSPQTDLSTDRNYWCRASSRTGATSWAFEYLTLLTVHALVGWTTYADSLNAGAVVGAGGVDALTFLHVTLCPLPPDQAHAPSFLIHPVAAAQHWARICGTEWTQISNVHQGRRACRHVLTHCCSIWAASLQ